MVDTVILHAPSQAAAAGALRDALAERFAITCEIGTERAPLTFGPQVLRVGVVAGGAFDSAEERAILALCDDGEGDRILMCADSAPRPNAGEDVEVIAFGGGAEADAERVRTAIAALRERARKGKKRGRKKDQRGASGGLAIAPAGAFRAAPPKPAEPSPASAPQADGEVLVAPRIASKPPVTQRAEAPKPAPAAPPAPLPPSPEAVIEITPAVARIPRSEPHSAPEVSRAPRSEAEAHDPEKARRARKVGFFAGIALGLAVMSVLVGLYIRSHEVQPSAAEVSPAAASAPAESAAPVAAPVLAPAATVPGPAPAAPPALRGTLEPQAVDAAPVGQSSEP